MSEIDVDKLRSLAAALNRAEVKYPNPFYVGFGAAILDAIGDSPANDIGATGRWRPEKSWGAPTAPPNAPVDLMAALRASVDRARTARGERTEEGHTEGDTT